MDIELNSGDMVLKTQYATVWLKYKSENKLNILILELLQGMHTKFELLFDDLLDTIR